eukprot:scaffold39804_cov68-Phaeocystis_antarctica.AAC.4
MPAYGFGTSTRVQANMVYWKGKAGAAEGKDTPGPSYKLKSSVGGQLRALRPALQGQVTRPRRVQCVSCPCLSRVCRVGLRPVVVRCAAGCTGAASRVAEFYLRRRPRCRVRFSPARRGVSLRTPPGGARATARERRDAPVRGGENVSGNHAKHYNTRVLENDPGILIYDSVVLLGRSVPVQAQVRCGQAAVRTRPVCRHRGLGYDLSRHAHHARWLGRACRRDTRAPNATRAPPQLRSGEAGCQPPAPAGRRARRRLIQRQTCISRRYMAGIERAAPRRVFCADAAASGVVRSGLLAVWSGHAIDEHLRAGAMRG